MLLLSLSDDKFHFFVGILVGKPLGIHQSEIDLVPELDKQVFRKLLLRSRIQIRNSFHPVEYLLTSEKAVGIDIAGRRFSQQYC